MARTQETYEHANADHLDEESGEPQNNKDTKLTLRSQPVPTAETVQELRTAPAGRPDKLCDQCLDFAKWISEIRETSEVFHFKSFNQIQKTEAKCRLCRVIVAVFRATTGKDDHVLKVKRHADDRRRIAAVSLDNISLGGTVHLAVHTDQEWLAQNISPLHPLPRKPCSAIYNHIKSWMSKCIHEHETCLRIESQTKDKTWQKTLPKRFLDVGQKGEIDVRLVESPNGIDQYCALSHCWGVKKPLRTTSKTLSSHLAGIRLEDLPKTFREAVEITRGIGIRYLWIDSLCIIQEDKQDWQQEAEKMANVYGGATLTIAATSAVDSTQGLFSPQFLELTPTSVPFFTGQTITGQFFLSQPKKPYLPHASPLKRRAWAFQEWYLSKRILHCTKSGLMWSCKEMHLDDRDTNFDFQFEGSHGTGDWERTLEYYSGTQLTFTNDRLVALQGMIRAMQETRPVPNVFGIWADDVSRGLLWIVSSSTVFMTGMDDVPSWSWAAKPGKKPFLNTIASSWESHIATKVSFYGSENRLIVLEGQLLEVDGLDDLDDLAASKSQLMDHKEAEFRLFARSPRFIRAKREGTASTSIGIVAMDIDNLPKRTTELSSLEPPGLLFASLATSKRDWGGDSLDDSDTEYYDNCTAENCTEQNRCFTCEMLGTPEDETLYWGLLLQPISKGSDRYRRMGMGMVWTNPSGPTREIYIE